MDKVSERPRRNARLLAFYLPQFHPIPENDAWWGKGFTEWTNVARARPLFPGHYQPRIPADLGFYDLRLSETRAAQAAMARRYGVEGFCYYHYWFASTQLLNRPFDEVVSSGEPDFPFCLCWANEGWAGVWHGAPKRILVEQTYPGDADHRRHFETLLPAFRDRRYVRVDGKPLFAIYSPTTLPDASKALAFWRGMAREAGLGGLHLVAVVPDYSWDPAAHGFDAAVVQRLAARRPWYHASQPVRIMKGALSRLLRLPSIHRYADATRGLLPRSLPKNTLYPCVIPNWDNTPRSGARGFVLQGSTPKLFGEHLRHALTITSHIPFDRRVIFVKSWNEWAEGNYLEPDRRFGHGYLEVLREVLVAEQTAPKAHRGLVGAQA